MSGTLILASSYERLAGNIVTLHPLPSASGHVVEEDYQSAENQISRPMRSMNYDVLLLGFAGHPRLSVNEDGRLEILQIKTRDMRLGQHIDLNVLARSTHGFVGADLQLLGMEAAFECIRSKMDLIDFDYTHLLSLLCTDKIGHFHC